MPGKLKAQPARKRAAKSPTARAVKTLPRRTKPKSPNTPGKPIASTVGDLFRAPTPAANRINVLQIRKGYGVSRLRFHRLSGFSERALANWETGTQTPDENTVRRLVELDRLRQALSRILQPDAIAQWLDTPNEAFGSLKPIEVVERGETDRLWRMIVQLDSGMPL